MRREGRQHGIVQAFQINPYLPDYAEKVKSRLPNKIDAPAMGIFVKVPSKPTNRSKYTSRCGRPRCITCHDHPVTKARPKTKGQHKHRDLHSFDDFYLQADRPIIFHDVEDAESNGPLNNPELFSAL